MDKIISLFRPELHIIIAKFTDPLYYSRKYFRQTDVLNLIKSYIDPQKVIYQKRKFNNICIKEKIKHLPPYIAYPISTYKCANNHLQQHWSLQKMTHEQKNELCVTFVCVCSECNRGGTLAEFDNSLLSVKIISFCTVCGNYIDKQMMDYAQQILCKCK